MSPIQLWGGPEYTVNRVGDHMFDQVARSGHDGRLEDLDRFATLGLSAIRYPVLWERHAPRAVADVDLSWADARLARLRELNIEPIVGLLHHGSGPAYTSLLDPAFPASLARYARAVAERYPWVTSWTPVNEPMTTARFSGLYGHWYPHARDDRAFVTALLNQMRAVVLAMREIRIVNPDARLVQTEDIGESFGTVVMERQLAHERDRRWLTWDLLAGRVGPDHPLRPFLMDSGATDADLAFFVDHPCPPDVVGLNYYLTSDRWLDERLELYPRWSHGGNRDLAYADVEAVRARPEGIGGHARHLRAAWDRYRLPVAITEVHLGCTREEQLRWLAQAWRDAHAAQRDGVDVRAVTAWALLGSYNWNSLVTRDDGHYEAGAFDIRAPTPRPTALAAALRDLAAVGEVRHPVVRGDGWWTRPERVLFGPVASELAPGARGGAPPVVVFGSRGTLGRAFERVCAMRGLPVHVVSRTDVDITDTPRVDALLRRISPWCVINAAGFVRVDAAESDRAACWRDNVTGVVNLAAACRRRGIQLATFSSDLVFDGAQTRPYVESDAPRPLNAYGESKVEAEARVLELCPTALVIRTSAFFGPWDDANFATRLWRAVAAGQRVPAASDAVVSPTYVPDLAHAVLDLLIDGEHGLWHLANDGAMTWYEFGRLVAGHAELDVDLIDAASVAEVWQPARRPVFSALASTRGSLLPTLEHAVARYAREMKDSLGAAESAARRASM